MKKFIASLLFALVVFCGNFAMLPKLALAEDTATPADKFELTVAVDNPICDKKGGEGCTTTIKDLIAKILKVVIEFAIPVVIVMVIYSGFLYVVARGKPESIEKAHKTLTWTLVGAAIILGAQLISNVIIDTVSNISSDSGINTSSITNSYDPASSNGQNVAPTAPVPNLSGTIASCVMPANSSNFKPELAGSYTIITRQDPLNIHCGPEGTPEFNKILKQSYPKGMVVNVIGGDGAWLKTDLGWIAKEYSQLKSSTFGGAGSGTPNPVVTNPSGTPDATQKTVNDPVVVTYKYTDKDASGSLNIIFSPNENLNNVRFACTSSGESISSIDQNISLFDLTKNVVITKTVPVEVGPDNGVKFRPEKTYNCSLYVNEVKSEKGFSLVTGKITPVSSTNSPVAGTLKQYYVNAVSGANLRSEPNTTSTAKLQPYGTVLNVSGETNGFWNIFKADKTFMGYILKSLLTLGNKAPALATGTGSSNVVTKPEPKGPFINDLSFVTKSSDNGLISGTPSITGNFSYSTIYTFTPEWGNLNIKCVKSQFLGGGTVLDKNIIANNVNKELQTGFIYTSPSYTIKGRGSYTCAIDYLWKNVSVSSNSITVTVK